MEKSDQNGDIEGDTSVSLEVTEEGGDLSEKVNGEVRRAKKKAGGGAVVEEDSVATGQESDEDFSQPEISRTSDYEEEEVSAGRVNGKVVQEEEAESDQETEDLVSERQNVEVSESTQEVEGVVEVTERQETLDEVTQGSDEEVEVSGRESVDLQEEAAPPKRKVVEYVEDTAEEDQDLATEEESVAEAVEEKRDAEPVTEGREEEEEVQEEEEQEAEVVEVPEEPAQEEENLVDCEPKTKEPTKSLKKTKKKEPAKKEEAEEEQEEEGRKPPPEALHRRRSSAESFQKLKDRFSNGTKVEENNRKNKEDEKGQGGAKNIMSEKSKRFGGTSEKCTQCNRTVYPMEKMEVAGRLLHKTCFKCCKCNSQLSVGRFSIGGKDMYCMTHYKQAFREKGNYDVFTPDNPIKGKWENK